MTDQKTMDLAEHVHNTSIAAVKLIGERMGGDKRGYLLSCAANVTAMLAILEISPTATDDEVLELLPKITDAIRTLTFIRLEQARRAIDSLQGTDLEEKLQNLLRAAKGA